jgi:hypothetical protein
MPKHYAAPATFQFKRATADMIQVYNEGSYLMAEYNESTGTLKWQRVLLATQREGIENWLREHYPASAAGQFRQDTKPPRPKASTRSR